MAIRLAFVGFRHAHIFDLYRRARETEELEVVAACEEDPEARRELAGGGKVEVTHDDLERMLETVDCDAVAVGDYYAKRGHIAIRALQEGKHIISDKPICTRLEELDEIGKLSKKKGLKVGCMLDMRDSPQFIGLRSLVRAGTIGEVHAIFFGGQHPLLLGTRPAWYFEPGKHGGTINDIGIHALDLIPWITGMRFTAINAARCWNAFAKDFPHFKDAGQLMLTMENGCGVLGDVSYFSPDSFGYSLPFYWRMTFWGEEGVLETSATARAITVALKGETEVRKEPLPPGNPGGYLRAFVHDIVGELKEGELCTKDVLRASRLALTAQKMADEEAGWSV